MRPVTAQPGHVEQDVHDLLATRQFCYADCYTITPRYGDPLRLTTWDRDVSVTVDAAPVVFQCSADIQVSGLRLKVSVGTEVDEQEITLEYNAGAEVWGLPIARAILNGRLDGATIRRDRFFGVLQLAGAPDWYGSTQLFQGGMSNANQVSRSSAVFSVKSGLVLLRTKVPRDLYQPGCNHVLYDPGCGLDREDWKVETECEAGSTASTLISLDAIASLALGVVHIDTPDGITLIRTIKEVSGTSIKLAYPLDFVPTAGTPFTAYQGCNRTRARCEEFSNLTRYKGFPYVPTAETAL